MDKEIKKAKIRKFFMVFIPVVLIFMEIATQSVAKDCKYDELLGIGIPIGDIKIYAPWMFFVWKAKFSMVIPTIIMDAQRYIVIGITIASLISMLVVKKMESLSSYGSAKWATKKDLRETGLINDKGVIVGINPYTFKGYKDKNISSKILRDDGPAHIGVFAPTRSGKGASIIIDTCLEWKHSLIVLDLKGENFNFTASYRKKALKNKIIKFEPFSNDGLSARWNPIAEVRMGTLNEMSDVMSLARMIADPTGKGGEKGDSHWIDTSTALIQTVILHLLYAHKRQDLPIPTLANVSDFLSSRDMPFDDEIDAMQHFDHISTKEFFEDNPFLKIYGNYIESSFKAFNENLNNYGIFVDVIKLKKIKEELKEEAPSLIEKYSSVFRTIREIQVYYADEYKQGTLNFEDEHSPFRCLLTHPKVAAGAAECANRDPKEQGSVTSSANAKFNLFRDPNVINNTSISEFTSTDVMNPNQAVTVYLVIPPNKVQDAIPLVRIFINYALDRNMEEMNFDKNKNKQRCLFLLDEFPQLGRIEKMETAMAIMAGYGLKTLFIAQDINQVNKNYSKDNSIISNCHIRIFFAPNEIETAENICKMLGKQTIEVANKSQSGAFNTSKSWNQTGRELLTPDEIMKMSKDEAIVLVAGFAPIKVKKAWYFKCPYFMSRTQNSNYPNALGENPMKSDTVTIIDSYDSLYKINGIKIKDNNDIKIHNGYSNSVAENKNDMPISNIPEGIDIDDVMKESSNSIITDDTPINNIPEGIDIDDVMKESSNSIITDDTPINNIPYEGIDIDDVMKESSNPIITDDTPINNIPYEGIDIDDVMKESSNPIITDDTPINNIPEGIDIDDVMKGSSNPIITDDTPINNIPEGIDIDDVMKESFNPIITDDTPINNIPEDIDNIIKPSFNSIDVDSDEKSVRNEVILLLKRMYSLNEDNAIKLLKRIDDIVIENKKREKLNYELKQKLKENLDIISKLNNNLKKAI
ncbi:MAG: type IV secretory system conjugative DNA transfer family protein [Megamonas funiformis]|uniref:type IV secretory system conjugative DNA transfer family protein n=1 Tax=Megamonas funiformis TaxID=437897 RepID=UPI002A81E43E|nr:type IV secretory system conjugative DNA transfer family protein [Megamonas funiformis]MDY3873925.1 type IV secretory system conjugative DNA transfer family protein [Megamonas funiformis]